MASRLELQTLLESFGVKVYFQPPSNLEMEYPCIVYSRDNADTEFAGNKPYRYTKRYSVIHISRDPDSEVPDQLAMLPLCTFSRHYVVDKLNHDAFSLYF